MNSEWLINYFTLPYPNALQIIQNLKTTIHTLETGKKIKLLKSLSGGSSAFLASAITKENKKIIVKIPLHELDLGVDFKNEMEALRMVAGHLGVLMREWGNELILNPKEKLTERLDYLAALTGLEKGPIWQWGLIQCVATGLVLLQADQQEEGRKLLEIAECWKGLNYS